MIFHILLLIGIYALIGLILSRAMGVGKGGPDSDDSEREAVRATAEERWN